MTTPPIDETILGPAIRRGDRVAWAPIPASHYSVSQQMRAEGIRDPLKGTQGFMTSDLRFVSREDAYVIATGAGQIVSHEPNLKHGFALFSEDLWQTDMYTKGKDHAHA